METGLEGGVQALSHRPFSKTEAGLKGWADVRDAENGIGDGLFDTSLRFNTRGGPSGNAPQRTKRKLKIKV